MTTKQMVKRVLSDKLLFKTQFELAKELGVKPVQIRLAVHQLRKDGIMIAKLARVHPVTGRMMPAHYYVPYHSRDLNIQDEVKRGRPARADAYVDPVFTQTA